MIDLIVYRGQGDNQGDDVQDILLSTTSAAIERGRHEINQSAKIIPISIRIPYKPDIQVGQIVEIIDSSQQLQLKGKIFSVNIDITPETSNLTLGIEVPI